MRTRHLPFLHEVALIPICTREVTTTSHLPSLTMSRFVSNSACRFSKRNGLCPGRIMKLTLPFS